MEEIARQGITQVIWNGKNVSEDIARFVSSVTYIDREEEASDEISLLLEDGEGLWSGDWYPTEGDTIELLIGYPDKLMNCGVFQVDEISASGPPDMLEVKAIAAGITKSLRTRNSKAFEQQTLRQIAQYFCTKHGFTLIDETGSMLSQINMDRKTQEEKTDLAFLSELATEYGFIFSVRGTKMVFTSYYNLDNAASIKSIDKNRTPGYSLKEKTFDTYAGAKVSSRNANESFVIEWEEESTNNKKDVLLLNGNVTNKQQAEAKVKSGLWNKNKFKQTGDINDLPGDPELVSGINFDLTGFRNFSGKYHIVSSTHSISGEGAYLTNLEIRKTGTIPKPQQVPAAKEDTENQFDTNANDYEENDREN